MTSPLLDYADTEAKTLSAEVILHKENNRFNRSLLFSFLRYGILTVTGFSFSMLYAHLLGAEIIGIVALLTSILGLFRPLSSLGEAFSLVPVLNRYSPKDSHAVRLFWKTVVLSAIITLLLSIPFAVIASIILAKIYHRSDLLGLLLIYIIGFYSIYNLVLLFSTPYQAYQEMKQFAYVELLTGLSKIGILVGIIISLGKTPLAAIWAQIGGNFINLVLLGLFMSQVFKGTSGIISSELLKKDLKEVYKYSFKALPGQASISILQHADRLILGYFSTPALLGVYALTYSLFERLLMLGTHYEAMMFSSASRLAAKNNNVALGSIYRSALKSSFFLMTPLLVAGIIFSDQVLALFGPSFAIGSKVLALLLGGLFFDIFARITTALMGGVNQPGLKAIIISIGALVNLVLNFLWIPSYSIYGAAAANMIGYVITALLCGLWLFFNRKISFINKKFLFDMGTIFIINISFFVLMQYSRQLFPDNITGLIIITAVLLLPYYKLGYRWSMKQEKSLLSR